MVWSQMRKYLAYLKWYSQLVQDAMFGADPWKLIDTALDPPVLLRSWKPERNQDVLLTKFGLLWKLYDQVRKKGKYWRPGILPEPTKSVRE